MASSSTPNHHLNHHLNHHQLPPTTATITAKKRKPPSHTPSSSSSAADTLFPPLAPADAAALNSTSSHLTTEDLLRRRLTLTRRLSRVYRHHFWTLMEDLRSKYRLYYWKYGVSPFSRGGFGVDVNVDVDGCLDNVPEDCGETNAANDGNAGENGGGFGKLGLGLGFGENCNYQRCGYTGCKFKAMALTSFCHMHIMSDPHQKLYKPCNFVIKNTEQGQILCEKPILSSAAPSLCASHLPKIHNDVKQALKKAGLSASSSGRLAPKFHVVLAEYVKLIQSKRRAAQKRIKRTIVIKDESNS